MSEQAGQQALLMSVPLAGAAQMFLDIAGGQRGGGGGARRERGGHHGGSYRHGRGHGRGGGGHHGGGGGHGQGGRGRGSSRGGQHGGGRGLHRVAQGRVERQRQQGAQSSGQQAPAPIFENYQLIGDSMISRISPIRAKYNAQKAKQIGYIVHGQTCSQLHRLIKSKSCPPLAKRLAILIGTNDALKNVPLECTKNALIAVLKCFKESDSIVLMTIPPIPRLDSQEKVDGINALIKEVAKDNVHVFDLHKLFVDESGNPKMGLFQRTFQSGDIDLIHFNKEGQSLVKTKLSEFFKAIEVATGLQQLKVATS